MIDIKSPGRPARGAHAALGIGVALCVLFVLCMDTSARPVLYLVGCAYGTLLSCLGAWRMPPARRKIWWALAAGQGLFLVGDVLYTLFEEVLHIAPYPSVADVAYLSSYPMTALGVMWLIRGRRRGRDRAAFLDAAIITTGVTVAFSVFVIVPAAEAGGTTVLERSVAAAYPAADLLLLAVVLRMLTGGMVRSASLWALTAGLALLLFVDGVYVMSVLSGSAYPSWIDPGFTAAYLLVGVAAVHPSAHALSEPAPDRPDQITGMRLAFLGGALVIVPVTDQVAHLVQHYEERQTWIVLVGGVICAVLVVLRMWDLVQRLQSKAVQLAALARKDSLTGVANRRTWDHELSRACAFAREHHTPLTVAVLDMDHFKLFNDRYGHVRGDLVLKETAAAWATQLSGNGFLARYGGEEFAVLLPRSTAAEAGAVLDRLRLGVTHDQTCSIGLAEWDGVESPAHVFARADEALYHAKHHGRDRIAAHDGVSARVVEAAARPESDVAEPRPVYQPIVDLLTGTTIAYEALSRFDGADPAEVFATATRLGTGTILEARAMEAAMTAWRGPEPLSVNVSLTALMSPDVQDLLPEDLRGLIFELTERDLVDYSAETMLVLEALRGRGAQIAVDDLGIGFSNIQRMVMMRPEIIKLDMSLVRGVDTDPMLQAVIAAAVVFAGQTGSSIVAEGVETAAERDHLIEAGVALAQGYLFGRPESLPELVVAETAQGVA